MRALTVQPGSKDSARVREVPEPPEADGPILVDVVFGSVNANRRHYEQAATALADADRSWLEAMISRRVPMERYGDALANHDDDVKVVLELTG